MRTPAATTAATAMTPTAARPAMTAGEVDPEVVVDSAAPFADDPVEVDGVEDVVLVSNGTSVTLVALLQRLETQFEADDGHALQGVPEVYGACPL